MDRRKSIKALALASLSTSLLVEACKQTDKQQEQQQKAGQVSTIDRTPEEQAHFEKINSEKFFTDQEMATITVLGDIMLPKDERSGSASDAKVPEFMEFIVKDMPEHQVPLRGGLRWLDMQCLKQFGKAFKDCSETEQLSLVDQIAYPKKAKPEMSQGVSFFSLLRDLVCTGFYTSETGVKDLGYAGNSPNQWNGVPEEVLQQYSLSYSEKELKECISFPEK